MRPANFNILFLFAYLVICKFQTAHAGPLTTPSGPTLPGYEMIPELRANVIVPAELRSGKNFTLDQNVGSNGYFNHYVMRSTYGIYEIESTAELRQRVKELDALNQLAEFTDSSVFLNAAGNAGKNVILAPVHAVQAVAGAVTDPGKTYESIKKVPAGILGFFGDVGDTVASTSRSIFGSGSSSSSSSKDSESKEEKNKGKSTQDIVVDTSVDAALGYVGYSKAQAAWYEKLQLDPYTTNKPLRERIAHIASIESGVNLGFKFVPGVVALGMLGTANKALSLTNRLALYADPKELKNRNLVALREMGISTEDSDAFFAAPGFSPLLATIVVDALKRCGDAGGRLDMLRAVSQAKTRPGAVFYAQALLHLSAADDSGKVVRNLIATNRLPAAEFVSGEVQLLLPIDYLFWTQGVANALANYPEKVRAKGIKGPITVIMSGLISNRTKSELEKRGMKVKTGLKLDI